MMTEKIVRYAYRKGLINKQQLRTLLGQIRTGDVAAARIGLQTILDRARDRQC